MKPYLKSAILFIVLLALGVIITISITRGQEIVQYNGTCEYGGFFGWEAKWTEDCSFMTHLSREATWGSLFLIIYYPYIIGSSLIISVIYLYYLKKPNKIDPNKTPTI